MIETYKDLHPNEVTEIGTTLGHGSGSVEDYEKYNALKKVREGTYESAFREKQGKKTSESSQGSPSLCVYGDS
jgi:hypothetical protein